MRKLIKEYIQKYVIQDEDKIKKFQYLRGPKKIERTTEEGFTYIFSEGGMSETDDFHYQDVQCLQVRVV